MSDDLRFMERALELARAGVGLASPNPCVGAVVVRDGAVVGEGTHTYDGRKHAEVLALEQAGAQARGATLYLNLEPCSHHGRTGPCAQAVVEAGIARVVCSMQDPNPAVAGRGFAILRAAGVAVEVGLLEAEAHHLNEAFAKWIRTRTPFVTLKSAITLDGRIAPPPDRRTSREPFWIIGEEARAHVHQSRHAADAILVGINTVLTDDPLLTDRSGLPRRRPLLRVVLDSHLRIPLDSKLVSGVREDLVVFHSAGESARADALRARGVRVVQVQTDSAGRIDFHDVLTNLGEVQVLSLIVEGGATINAAALNAGIVDRLNLYLGPRVLGRGVPWLSGPATSVAVKQVTTRQFGDDLLIDALLRDPYPPHR